VALGIYFFDVKNMPADKFREVHRRLDAIGQANPPGRTFHAGFHVDGVIQVFDVWETEQDFAAFGEHLMPILAELGIDPGEPQISPIELMVTPT
jgi:hypothetical protein